MCIFDTDGDGNCPIHPQGCPAPSEGLLVDRSIPCPVCDRANCPAVEAGAVAAYLWTSNWRTLRGDARQEFKLRAKAATAARREAKRECQAHAVDWRQRALAEKENTFVQVRAEEQLRWQLEQLARDVGFAYLGSDLAECYATPTELLRAVYISVAGE